MKFLLFKIICLLLSYSVLFSFTEQTKILEPNGKERLDPVLSNIVFIRIKPFNKEDRVLQSLSTLYGTKIISRLIEPQYSVTFNKKIRKDVLLSKNQDLTQVIKAEEPLLRTFIAEFNGDVSPEEYCSKLSRSCSDIELAEPYIIFDYQGKFIPNDTYIDKQAMFEIMQVFDAFDIFEGDSSVVIGISDTGVKQDHVDLINSLWHNPNEIPDNGIDDDNNGYIDDWNGYNFGWQYDNTQPGNTLSEQEHGTGVAGIAGATTNNGIGIAGLAFNCKIFPMKTAINGYSGSFFSYESLIYSAIMGFDVVNCSWGSFTYSCVFQSIIDYAVSRDVALVVSAGNHGNTTLFYPAACQGVLSVGVTTPGDTLKSSSAYGTFVRIVAPGDGTLTTSNKGNYGYFGNTSAAAPIVAAAVGLIRAKHPELSALQALELARISTDDISEFNPSKKLYIPGRINFLKAVTTEPFSTPSVVPKKAIYFNTENIEIERFNAKDTVKMKIDCFNYLGAASDLTCKLSVVNDNSGVLHILDSIVNISEVRQNSKTTISEFKFIVEKQSTKTFFFRIDLSDGKNYKDFFLISFIPTLRYNNFSSDSIKFSACDNGRIGFYDTPNNKEGIGFTFKDDCNILNEGSLMVSENQNRLVNQARGVDKQVDNDFATVKQFILPNENIGIFADDSASADQKIDIEISNEITTYKGKCPCVKFDIRIKNKSEIPLKRLAAGYFLDWDIGEDKTENYVSFEKSKNILLVSRTGNYPFIAHYVESKEKIEPQLASFDLNNYVENGFSKKDKISLLNSGTNRIYEFGQDIGTVIGARFVENINANDEKSFSLLICCSDDYDKAIEYIESIKDSTSSSVEEISNIEGLAIYPNPAENIAVFEINMAKETKAEIKIYSLIGELVASVCNKVYTAGLHRISFDASNLANGVYNIVLSSGSKKASTFMIVDK